MDEQVRENVVEWVKRLRRRGKGRYAQGRGQLRNSNEEYCCLGVGADVLADKGLGTWDTKTSFTVPDPSHYSGGLRCHATLEEPARKLLGLSEKDMDVLIEMNDDVEASLGTIAGWIERNILEKA